MLNMHVSHAIFGKLSHHWFPTSSRHTHKAANVWLFASTMPRLDSFHRLAMRNQGASWSVWKCCFNVIISRDVRSSLLPLCNSFLRGRAFIINAYLNKIASFLLCPQVCLTCLSSCLTNISLMHANVKFILVNVEAFGRIAKCFWDVICHVATSQLKWHTCTCFESKSQVSFHRW